MHGAVLRVDGHDLRARCHPRPLNQRARGDQGLLVREGQALSRPQGCQGDGQAREPDNTVEDDVGLFGYRGKRALACEDLGARGDEGRQLVRFGWVGDGHLPRVHLARLLREKAYRRPGPERYDLEQAWVGAHYLQRLGADRAGAASDGEGPAGGALRQDGALLPGSR